MEAFLEVDVTRDLRLPEQSTGPSRMVNKLSCIGRINTESVDGLEEITRHEEVSLTNKRPMLGKLRND